MLRVLILVGIGLTLSLAEYVPGQVIVKYKDTPSVVIASSRGSISSMNNRHPNTPFIIHRESSIIEQKQSLLTIQGSRTRRHPFEGLQRIEFDPSTNIDEALNWIRSQPDVEYAFPNVVMRALDTVPNDEYYMSNQRTNDTAMFFENAWDISTGSASIIVAVIDTGVDYTHPDLMGKVIKGHDYVNNDEDPLDDNGHGTHVAGIVAAIGNNSIGVSGVNWNCQILAEKVLDSLGGGNSVSASLAIIDAVDAGAAIINLSLGGTYTSGYDIAIDYAYDHNVVVVAAMGNYGPNGENRYTTGLGTDVSILKSSPACNDSGLNKVIGVANLNYNKKKSDSSNYSNLFCDISAVGTNIYSTTLGHSYVFLSGTSMASPMIAGVASLILSISPNLSVSEVKTLLFGGAHNIDSFNSVLPNGSLGSGIVDAYRSLFSMTQVSTTNSGMSQIVKFFNYKNPVELTQGATSFHIETTTVPESCSIKIFSLSGKLIKTFVFIPSSWIVSLGDDNISWTLRDESGNYVPTGVYIAILDVRDSLGHVSRKSHKVLVK